MLHTQSDCPSPSVSSYTLPVNPLSRRDLEKRTSWIGSWNCSIANESWTPWGRRHYATLFIVRAARELRNHGDGNCRDLL